MKRGTEVVAVLAVCLVVALAGFHSGACGATEACRDEAIPVERNEHVWCSPGARVQRQGDLILCVCPGAKGESPAPAVDTEAEAKLDATRGAARDADDAEGM